MHLLWLSCVSDWFMEETDSEAEEERYANPSLRILTEVYLDPGSEFSRTCFGGVHRGMGKGFRLLDAVSIYLIEVSEMQDTFGCPEAMERSWDIFIWCGRKRLCNIGTAEWFDEDSPPVYWQRYYYFPKPGMRVYWWCSGARWFIEPRKTERSAVALCRSVCSALG